MQQDNEIISLKSSMSIISNKARVTREFDQNSWLLTYLRRPNADHAFLLMEGFLQMKRTSKVAQFIVKPGTDGVNGTIRFEDISDSALRELSRDCIGLTAKLSLDECQVLFDLIEAQRQLGEMGQLNYIQSENSKISPRLGKSMGLFSFEAEPEETEYCAYGGRIKIEQVLRTIPDAQLKRKLLKVPHLCSSSIVKLFVPSHNSCTWAEAMMKAIKLSPEDELQQITMDSEDIEDMNAMGCCFC